MRDNDEFELVVPFVACQSQGGPYDDESFIEGYRCAMLDVHLSKRESRVFAYVRPAAWEQVDLIAMRHGYIATFDQPTDGWLPVTFQLAAKALL